jgi:hypothetical protein
MKCDIFMLTSRVATTAVGNTFWKYKDHEMLGEEDVILQWH